jgi:hypothetical protein
MTSEVLSAPNWQKDFECLCGTGEGGHLSVPVWKWEGVRTADANRQLSIPSSHRNAVRASQATARFVAATKAEGKAGMKKCGAQNPITALDGALSCAYLDAEIDRRCLARGAMLGAGPAPARPSS